MLVFNAMGSALSTPAAEVSPALQRFCLAQANAFVVPAEVLGEHGVEHAFGALLVHEKRLSADQLACLSYGFRLYWQRCRALHVAAPGAWFPPRQTNLLVVAETRGVLPYLEPFRGTSSMLYTADLDTHPEYVAALLVHMERLSLLRSVPATIAYNLSYWFERDATSRQAFAAAASRARRPDAAAFVALAEAFAWIDELLHDPLRVPQQELTEPHLHIDGADLYVPKRLQPQLTALGAAAEEAVRAALAAPAVISSAFGRARRAVRLAASVAGACHRAWTAWRHAVDAAARRPDPCPARAGRRQRRSGGQHPRRPAHDR